MTDCAAAAARRTTSRTASTARCRPTTSTTPASPLTGTTGHYAQVPREVDDFKQAGDLYRLQPRDAQQRLVDNIAGSLAQVSRDDIIARSVEQFRKADAEFGSRIAAGIAARRGAAATVGVGQ